MHALADSGADEEFARIADIRSRRVVLESLSGSSSAALPLAVLSTVVAREQHSKSAPATPSRQPPNEPNPSLESGIALHEPNTLESSIGVQ